MAGIEDLPKALREMLPPGLVPATAEYVIVDPKAGQGLGDAVKRVRAYTRALGTEHVACSITELPGHLAAPAIALAGAKADVLTGAHVLEALAAPNERPLGVL